MRKRKERRERSETLIPNPEEEHEGISKEEEQGFFACYLLCSLSPRFKGHTYIGFTINPRRRIRQHNGEMSCGAWRTKSKRPWEMILCIYGFPTNVSALQFEWAWQHPTESLAVRKAATSMKSLSGIANKIKLAYTMLTLPAWQSLKLTVNFFSTKYMKHSAGCPSLPKQMKVQFCSMDELPCYMGARQILDENEDDEDDECEDDENGNSDKQLKEGMTDISVYDTAEYHCSIVKTARDRPRWIEDDDSRQPGKLPIPIDHRQPFCLVDSPMRISSSSITSLDNTVETVEDRDPFASIEESSNELRQAAKQQPETPIAANNDRPPSTNILLFSPEFEVINMLTPSSDCIIRSFRKRKKTSLVRHEIIDLTKSPIFIQL